MLALLLLEFPTNATAQAVRSFGNTAHCGCSFARAAPVLLAPTIQAGPRPVTDSAASFGQRLTFGFIGAIAGGAIAMTATDSEAGIAAGYIAGTVIGIGITNKASGHWQIGPAVIGAAIGAVPFIMGLAEGEENEPMLVLLGLVSIPLGATVAYEVIR